MTISTKGLIDLSYPTLDHVCNDGLYIIINHSQIDSIVRHIVVQEQCLEALTNNRMLQ